MKPKKKSASWRILQELQWLSFLLPTIVCLLLLTYRPLLTGIRYSFYKVQVIGFGESFIGLKNYTSLLGASIFRNAVRNTLILALYSLAVIPLGFLLASLINSIGRGRLQSFFRVSYYLPNILTGVSVVLLFQYILREDSGLLNAALSLLAGRKVDIGWLTNSHLTKAAVSIMSTWSGLGYAMLINLAGLQSIPREIYESAEIDGGGSLQKMVYITIPNMTNTFTFLFITSVIASFARFNDLFIISGNSASGRPGYSLQTILMYIYQFSFDTPDYGLSSAGAMLLFLMTLAVTLVNLRVTGFFKRQA